jgi:hypothetical protein
MITDGSTWARATAPTPRSVLVADESLYLELKTPKYIGLLDDLDAMVVPYSGTAQVHAEQVAAMRELLVASDQLIPRALLVKNPYEAASYEFAELAVEAFVSTKYHALANVARLLGAKQVRFIEAKADRNTSSFGAELKARIPIGGGQAKVDRQIAKKLEARLEGQMSFPGGEAAIDDALAYLRRRNLANDHQLRDLVEMRTGGNRITEYKVTFSGTREATANLRSALTIASADPVKSIDFGATFSSSAESISNIEITTEIHF